MKIKSIGISNILSFKSRNDIVTNPDITFEVSGTDGNLHILIGPNGSGKSNFVEVLNQVFNKALFLATKLDESYLMRESSGTVSPADLKKTMNMEANENNWGLAPHRESINGDQRVRLVLGLNDHDISNLHFLNKNREIINQLLKSYCTPDIYLPAGARFEILRAYTEITLQIESTTGRMPQLTLDNEQGPEIVFIKHYLLYFKVLQDLIKVYNRYIKAPTDPEWPVLHETFVMLGSYRNYAGVGGSVPVEANRSLQQINQRLRNQSTRHSDGGGEPAVFEFVKRIVGNRFVDLLYLHGRDKGLDRLYNEEPLVSINQFLYKYLGIKIEVYKPPSNDMSLEMIFVRADGSRINPSDLSSGQKGILHFIFTIYGFDLKHGVVIIDEPELHLHPQMQREYLKIIEDVRRKFDIQFILVTHSPIFVNQATIDHVCRFTFKEGSTQIIIPSVEESEKNLTRILDLTNSAKIFFVNKAILVEGETDEYFFRFLLDQMQATGDQSRTDADLNWKDHVEDFEIFNIKGKGGRITWTKFLEEFGLQVYFVGDWDNIKEVGSYNLKEYQAKYLQATQKAAKNILDKGSADGATLFKLIGLCIDDPSDENLAKLGAVKDYIVSRHYPYAELIRYLKQSEQKTWRQIEQDVESAYPKRIFILKLGELEDYIPLAGKPLDKYTEHRADLEKICSMIFSDSQKLGTLTTTKALV
jgi:predicted ATPase